MVIADLALSPDDWLGLFAAALLAGLRGPQAGRWALAALPATWLVGALAGLLVPGVPALPGLSILSFVALGVLVALDVKLPAWGVSFLGGLFGLLHGLLNGAALSQADGGLLNVLGIVTTAFLLTLSVLMVVSLGAAVHACVGCFRLPYKSVLEKVESSDRVVVAHLPKPTGASWKIDQVIKGQNASTGDLPDVTNSTSNIRGPQILRWGTAALLQKWIDQRWAGGDQGYLAAVLTAYVEIHGEEAVRFIEASFLQDHDRTLKYLETCSLPEAKIFLQQLPQNVANASIQPKK